CVFFLLLNTDDKVTLLILRVIAMDRARKSGYVLADILIERVQGNRPTTLIGYSTGTVVIWECLLELARRKEHGLVNSGTVKMHFPGCHAEKRSSRTDNLFFFFFVKLFVAV